MAPAHASLDLLTNPSTRRNMRTVEDGPGSSADARVVHRILIRETDTASYPHILAGDACGTHRHNPRHQLWARSL